MTPPRLARRLLALLAPQDLRATFVDDLDETFARHVATDGSHAARWWYRRQALRSVPAFVALRARRNPIPTYSEVHAMTPTSSFAALWQDLAGGWRALRSRPLFAAVAVLSLALGIGASTAMFSIVYGVLLRPLDLPNAGQVLLIGERAPELPGFDKFAYFDTPAAFYAWRQQATDFTGLAALQGSRFTLPGGGRPQLVYGAHVTPNFFDVLNVQPQVGRLLVPSDETDTTRPMVITDRLWHAAFGGDPAAIGRRIGAPGAQATVVGVLPATFHVEGGELGPMLAGQSTDYFDAVLGLPKPSEPDGRSVFGNFNYHVVGRLRPGVTQADALAQLNVIQAQLARSAPENAGQTKLSLFAIVSPLRDYAVADARQPLWLLLGGVLAVLLVVSVNLGGLSITRVADQRRDWAIRAALGAAPGRLARQALGESLALALTGGLLGVGCAGASLALLLAAAPEGVPRLDQVHMDWRVLAFGLGVSVLAGVVTGLVPALRLRRAAPQESLKLTATATTADRGSLRSRQILIGVQAALSTVLLAVAGLLGLSFYRVVSQPTGFDAARGVAADIMLSAYSDEAHRDQILRQLPAEVAALPGVEAVGFTSHLPLQGETWIDSIQVPGRTAPPGQEPHVNVRFISADYFKAIGIPLLAGRSVAESDRPSGPPPTSAKTEPAGVTVLSRATARMLWPDAPLRDLIGRDVDMQNHSVHVIGIADDVRASLTAPVPSVAYVPYWEYTPYTVSLVVRGASSPSTLAGPLRAAIWRVAPLAPVPKLRGLADLETTAVASQRYQLTLLALFAALALLLAAMGVYALVAHSVARRRKELALRVTLGAPAAHLWRLVLSQALVPVAVGVLVGVAVALAGGRLLTALLFEVSPSSPAVLAPVALAVVAAASAACYLSARRGVHADPWAALRAE